MAQPFGRITANLETIHRQYDPVNFVGRKWLIDEVARFKDSSDGRQLIIVGEPGSGKSTFAAYLAQTWNCPCHFIRVGHIQGVSGLDPRAFLISIGSQLYQKYGRKIFRQATPGKTNIFAGLARDHAEIIGRAIEEYYTLPFLPIAERDITINVGVVTGEARVIGETIRRVIDITLGLDETTLLHAVLINPLSMLLEINPLERVLIIVDALDECFEHPSKSISDFILQATDASFPSNLRMLITCRPGEHLVKFRNEDLLYLDDKLKGYWQNNLTDIRNYIEQQLGKPPLANVITAWSKTETANYMTDLEKKSDGNFLYLYYFFNEVVDTISRGKRISEEYPSQEH